MATALSALGVVFLGSLFSTALGRRDKGLDADIISLQDAAAPIPLVVRQNGRAHDARGMVMRILQVGDGAAKNIPRRNVSRPEPSYRSMIYLPASRVSVPDSEGPIVFVVDDDPFTRGSLSSLFRSVGLKKVKALASAADLLEIITRSGIPTSVFNLVVGSGSTSSSGSPIFPLRVCTNCCPENGSSRAKPTNPPIGKLPNLHAALS
ncbi:hypothetical protein [Bradyrhizobium liaoningense]|uniref:hypothetical protein n=1 Tax=Bradyrhizobium liaoningense TaxID=43992 RepID=UPI001BA560EC|nr:hypothetical protein [Bradyrhizobium liaoningense]MBR1170174.1 hypothetical protein [Bradyrhizobium liaoningense]